MDQERQRIQDDLRGLVKGDVRCDDVFLQLYASDASVYQILPLGIVIPKTRDDAIRAVNLCREYGTSITARGGGTSQAGQAIGDRTRG